MLGGYQLYAGDDCIRCHEAKAVDQEGFCGHCHWAIRTEITIGVEQLNAYLDKYARYEDWCRQHGVPA
jgi:hypothetical protein